MLRKIFGLVTIFACLILSSNAMDPNNNDDHFNIIKNYFKEQSEEINHDNAIMPSNIIRSDAFIIDQNHIDHVLEMLHILGINEITYNKCHANSENNLTHDDNIYYLINIPDNSSNEDNVNMNSKSCAEYLDDRTKDKMTLMLLSDRLRSILNSNIFKCIQELNKNLLNNNKEKKLLNNYTEVDINVYTEYKEYYNKICNCIQNNISPILNNLENINVHNLITPILKCDCANKISFPIKHVNLNDNLKVILQNNLECLRDQLVILKWILNDTLINTYKKANNIQTNDAFYKAKPLDIKSTLLDELIKKANDKSFNDLHNNNDIFNILSYICIIIMDICEQNILSIKQIIYNNFQDINNFNNTKKNLDKIIELFKIK